MVRFLFAAALVCAPVSVMAAGDSPGGHASSINNDNGEPVGGNSAEGVGNDACDIDRAEAIDLGKAAWHCSHAAAARLDRFTRGPGVEPREPGSGPRGAIGNTDVTHYRLDIEILPQENIGGDVIEVRVDGTNTIDVTVVDANVTNFIIDLDDTMTVTGVTGDVAGYSHAGDQIDVTLDRAYAPGEAFQIVVAYNGAPDTAGFGAFKWWIRNGNLAIATLSEPYFAPLWWPCNDSLSDKATMEMIVTVPDPLVVASNGNLESVTPLGGGRTQYHWHEINPMVNYLASLAITHYERYDLTYEYDDGNGGTATMPVLCYLYPESWDFINDQPLGPDKAGCDELLPMLSVFESKFGPYPFRNEKYGVAETGGDGGLGANMEHQTISSMWRVRNYSDIMAHEMAHHWFGDHITCATWYDIWLNEGLTSYLEAVYREFKPGGGLGSYWARMIARYPDNPDARVYRNSIGSVGAIFSTNDIYNKGAWVCHMLRHVLGDDAFFQAIADYRAAYQSGFATTADFTETISASFGHDLTFFTDQWVMNPGAPDYVWRYRTETVNGAEYLYLQVEQQQDQQGFGLFAMPIDVRITTSAGTSVQRIWNDALDESYVIPLDGALVDVEFDEADGVDNRQYILTSSRTFDATAPTLPPVVVAATVNALGIVPGESTVALTFSEDIGTLGIADVALVGATTGSHAAATVAYNAATQTATVTYNNLPNDSFTFRVLADNVMANGMPLDGEVDDAAWYDDVLLPSGDGQPGGDAIFTLALLAGDANCSGDVTLDDVAAFTAVLLGTDTDVCHVLRSDANNDGVADGRDVAGLVAALVGL